MEKKLITEINRNLEIMGINKPLLTESVIGEFLQWAKPTFVKAAKQLKKGGDDIVIGVEHISKNLFKKFSDIIDEPQLINTLTADELKVFYKILSNSDNFVNRLYRSGLQEFIKRHPQFSETQIIQKLIDTAKSNGKTIKETVLDLFGDVEYAEILEKKFKQKIEDLNVGKFVEEITPIVGKETEHGFVEFIREYTPMIVKFYKQTFITYLLKKDDELLKLANKRLAIIAEKLSRTPPSKIDADLEQLFIILTSRKRWNTKSMSVGLEKYIVNNSNLDPDVVKNFMSRPEVVAVIDKAKESSKSAIDDMLKQRLKASIDAIPGLSFIQDGMVKGWKDVNYGKLIGNPARVWKTILWKDSRFFWEAMSMAMRSGTYSHLIGAVISFGVFELAIQPLVIAVLKIMTENDGIINQLNKEIAVINRLCDEGVLENCDEHIEELVNLTEKDFKEAWKESIPFYAKLYRQQNPNDVIDENGIIAQFTLIDEVINMSWSIAKSVMFGKGAIDEVNRQMNDYLKKKHEELYNELVRRGLDPGGENIQDVLKQLELNKGKLKPRPDNGGNNGGQPVEPPVDETDPDKQQNEFGF